MTDLDARPGSGRLDPCVPVRFAESLAPLPQGEPRGGPGPRDTHRHRPCRPPGPADQSAVADLWRP
ncbi:hypothetical protein [Ornithinimicrobium kibberense]|uniref:hypothetical protein n=1 Tax=Ornithinimicrobium kibberense TaxID=282060 RepID=UPI00360C05A9